MAYATSKTLQTVNLKSVHMYIISQLEKNARSITFDLRLSSLQPSSYQSQWLRELPVLLELACPPADSSQGTEGMGEDCVRQKSQQH